MTIKQWLRLSEQKLAEASIGTARLDSLVLIEDELERDRSWLLAHDDLEIASERIAHLRKKLARRAKHEPLAYVRGWTEFYGRRFMVNKDVLEPRSESETMIELLKQLAKSNKQKTNWLIADIGTGSGALAVTAKLELAQADVIATDIDPKCLSVARQNARLHKAKVKFLQGDLLQPLIADDYRLTAVMANLPYVPRNLRVNPAAAMEPKLAIDGGSDGLDTYRRFLGQLTGLNQKPKFIFTESLPPQHQKLSQIALTTGYNLQKNADFIQLFVGSF